MGKGWEKMREVKHMWPECVVWEKNKRKIEGEISRERQLHILNSFFDKQFVLLRKK